MPRKMTICAAVLTAILAVLLGAAVFAASSGRPAAAPGGEAVIVTVRPGMSTGQIAVLLQNAGVIENPFLCRLLARLDGLESSLQAGEYALRKGMTPREILRTFARGETVHVELTVPEGYTVSQIASLIEEKKLGSSARFRDLAARYAPYGYMEEKPGQIYRAEGFLFPDTYRLARGMSEEQILQTMLRQFDERFTPAMRLQAAAKGLSVQDVAVIASLVEREARAPEERAMVAAVFLRRLKIEMPLQSCATIQYILGYPKPELTVQDTEIPSPYNTYRHMGLPPGPVANPGLAAIQAVLEPSEADYLYFVARADGRHIFSRSYNEHLAAIGQVKE